MLRHIQLITIIIAPNKAKYQISFVIFGFMTYVILPVKKMPKLLHLGTKHIKIFI
jgi:hypothetical protein